MTLFYSNCKVLFTRSISVISLKHLKLCTRTFLGFKYSHTAVLCGHSRYKCLFDAFRPTKLIKISNIQCINTMLTSNNLSNKKLEDYLKDSTVEKLVQDLGCDKDHIVVELVARKDELVDNLNQLYTMKECEKEKEMIELIQEDINAYLKKLTDIYLEMIEHLLPKEDFEDCNDVMLEIFPGVGGLEAMLFAGDLRNMYCGFLDYKGWQYSFAENDDSELGGVRRCSMFVSGVGAYSVLQHEAGVHRVQRVPQTERGGRVHTSTVSVAVLPQPSDVEINIKDNELKIDTMRASGAGGQHVNTTDSAVRITHLPTGTVVECQTERNQISNKKNALKRLRTILYEKEMNKMDSNIRSQRKMQIGTRSRSEKIRTYNYRDDRISDHRLTTNLHNLRQFLEGGKELDDLLDSLSKQHHETRLRQFVDSITT